MSSALEPTSSPTDSRPSDERKQSPPAFLDLADSAARLGTNMPDISARVELKRMEHERQRVLQRKMFEDQMRALEQQQAQELLSLPVDANGNSLQHFAVSAPTTPPRVNAALNGEASPSALAVDAHMLSHAVGKADKRKSVTYASSVSVSPDMQAIPPDGASNAHHSFSRTAGAKSMPASRRTSASSHDEELASHLEGLSMVDNRASPLPSTAPQSILRSKVGRFGNEHENGGFRNVYNAGMMLDEQLDEEMHNAMRNLPTSDDDKFSMPRGESYTRKLSTSSAALDLAPLSQTPPRGSFVHRTLDSREKPSEWPQFSGTTRGPEGTPARNERRTVTTPQIGLASGLSDLGKLGGTVSASGTPHIQQHTPGVSRRSSPLGISTNISRADIPHIVKTSTSPMSAGTDPQALNGRLSQQGSHQINENTADASDLTASLSRIPPSQYDNSPLNFGTIQPSLDEPLQYEDSIYSLNGPDNGRFNNYNFDSNGRMNARPSTGGSTALYHHHGSRYGLGMGQRMNSAENKMNGLHGPKHKRGDIDREFNRFAGTRLEDLQGEIPSLCKDQHGCRYLQKKLEEGVPEHRDMIFRETFGHFADLMTDPFGNYLCQKLLEFSTDEQRNVICESVAQDLVNISLNMHGTRAVQKMIDFLSTQRQADLRYNAQIHSIIVALSLHVVVLIKDLNGNHVIQKCLNKLAPEDNQFIYNAVAANCVEVATHRHGCCVLQRCIDHASDQQRVQLVNEITYNALTLVQDPYGNYVVQYILDLNDNRFSDGVIRQFTGNVCALSVQKFSSNVIEKCIRVAEHSTRKMLIEELLNRTRLEKLLRDSFGNYCVQTALDYAEPAQRAMLVEGIRPILPLIRNTPYGKRIQSKLQREQMELANGGGHYGGYHNQQQALVNMALATHGLGAHVHGNHGVGRGQHLPHQTLHANPLADVYTAQNSLYNLGQGGAGLHGQQALHIHGQQQLPHSMQTHHAIDGYVLQGTPTHSHSMGSAANGFGNAGSFGNGIPASFGNSVGGLNDPYQRSSFGYGV